MENKQFCKKQVWHDTWHPYPCGNPAKWIVDNEPRCGIHSRNKERKPISEGTPCESPTPTK